MHNVILQSEGSDSVILSKEHAKHVLNMKDLKKILHYAGASSRRTKGQTVILSETKNL